MTKNRPAPAVFKAGVTHGKQNKVLIMANRA